MEPHSFIVRIWLEQSTDEDRTPLIRGSIEDVGTHEALHFCRLDSIQVFIRRQLQLDEARSRFQWRKFFSRLWHGD